MSAAGSRVHVEVRGTGPNLVLLHGWALHGGIWGPWLDRLAERLRLHIVDLPGHGRSPWVPDIGDLGDLARAVDPAVPAGAAVLGWSLGGLVALEIARRRPADIAGLVCIATTPRFLASEDWPHGMSREVLRGFAEGLAQDYRRTIANFLALQTWGDEAATATLRTLRSRLAAHGEPDPRALATGLEILRDADLRDALPAIAAPALVVAGDHDRITPAAAGRALASRLPSARFVEVPKAGHAPFLSHPDAVLRPVQQFLSFLDDRRQPRRASNATTPAPRALGRSGDGDSYALDASRVRASFGAAAATYDAAAVLQSKVRTELLDRLEVVRMKPEVVLDLGTGTGQGALALKRRYPGSHVVACDIAVDMLEAAARRQTLWRRFQRVAGTAEALPFRDGSLDMVFSNLVFQWCNQLDEVLSECGRVLRPGGVLHFTTFGPDTLVELRRAWAEADPAHAHVSRFLDMHDIGDALVRAGFAEPVLDVERHTLTYGDAQTLMRDLKAIGAHNATAGRARGLTGKAKLARMLWAYERCRRPDGQLPATYEVVFAQAWSPPATRQRASRPDGEVLVPLSRLARRREK